MRGRAGPPRLRQTPSPSSIRATRKCRRIARRRSPTKSPKVFRFAPGYPTPISYIRVLLGVEMCRQFYGAGPWDDLAQAWTPAVFLQGASSGTGSLLRASLPVASRYRQRYAAPAHAGFRWGDRLPLSLTQRVKPETLLAPWSNRCELPVHVDAW